MFSSFQTVSRVVFGRGSAAELGSEAHKLNAAKVGLITDAGLTKVETDVDSLKSAIDYSAYACAQSDKGKQILAFLGK